MRLLQLHIKRYGHFTDMTLKFPGDGLQVVYGPNEAGKSTLLEFVREILFGFEVRTKYNFGGGRLEGGATMRLADGRTAELFRRKGRGDTASVLIDGQEQPLDGAAFHRLVENASKTLFRSVFAFGLEELAEGEKTLGEQSVRSALYSGGLGGAASPRKILEALKSEADTLYTDRGYSKPINRLFSELKDLNRQVIERSVRSESYEQRRAELQNAQEQANALAAGVEELSRAHSLVGKLVRALPVWHEAQRLRQERQDLRHLVPEGLPPDVKDQFDRLQAELARQEKALVELGESLSEHEEAWKQVSVDPRVVDRKAEIQFVREAIQSIKDARPELPVRQGALAATLRALEEELARLVSGWTLENLEGFLLRAPEKAELIDLETERKELETERTTLDSERKTTERELRATAAAREKLGEPADTTALAGLLDHEADHASDRKERVRLQREIRENANTLDALVPRLNPPLLEPAPEACTLPVPPRAAVDDFKQELAKLREQVGRTEHLIGAGEDRLTKLKQELLELDAAGGEIPRRELLGPLRAERDAGWELIRRTYVAGEDVSRESTAWLSGTRRTLPDVYEERVRAADQYADSLFDRSRSVAKQEEIGVAMEDVAKQKRELAAKQSQLALAEQRWRDLWRPCGFVPLDPDAMAGWLDLHRRLCELVQNRALLAGHLQDVTERLASYESRLRGALGGETGDTPRLLVVARKQVEAAARQQRDIEAAEQTLHALRLDEAENRRKEAGHQERSQAWNARRQAVLQRLGFPDSWTLELARQVIAELQKHQVTLGAARQKQTEIATTRARLEEFDQRVHTLCAELAPELLDRPGEVAAAVLGEYLSAHDRRVLLESTLAAGRKQQRVIERELQEVHHQIAGLYQAADVADAAAFRQVAERAARIAELDQALASQDRELHLIRENEPPEEFAQQLQEGDLELLNARLYELSNRLTQASAEKTEADQKVGACRQALTDLERGGGDAAMALQEVASRRAALAANVDRYIPLLFAHRLLANAIQRFEKESQPEMLREVSRIFQTMTDGRYIRVERPHSESGPFSIHRDSGETREPHELSTGTREQLYLAVRLAYVLHYCERAEPLPIIMDDVLANFDDDRARHTVRALGELTDRVQIIMFTCHHHLVALAREVFPPLQPVPITREVTAEPIRAEAAPSRKRGGR